MCVQRRAHSVRKIMILPYQSGFTAVAVNANTNPDTDSKSDIQFLKSKIQNSPVDLYPIGALTTGSKGQELAE